MGFTWGAPVVFWVSDGYALGYPQGYGGKRGGPRGIPREESEMPRASPAISHAGVTPVRDLFDAIVRGKPKRLQGGVPQR